MWAEWILREAVASGVPVGVAEARGDSPVNLSPAQFLRGDVVGCVISILLENPGLNPVPAGTGNSPMRC